MKQYSLKDHVLGCLYAAGIGDAMGAPSEAFSRQEIKEKFNGGIRTFHGPGENMYVQGNIAGEVTDDTTQMYEMAKAILQAKGQLSVEDAARALVGWSKHYPKYYPRNAGTTTRYVIEELKNGLDPTEVGKTGGIYGRGTSNGAAMRIAGAGLRHPKDMDGAMETAITMTKPSHGTQHAYAGACAIACGIAKAMSEDADVFSVLKACLYGAKKGEERGCQEARIAAGEAILPKIMRAVHVALTTDTMEDTLTQLDAYVGNDGSIQSSVASAIGIFLAVEGDIEQTVLYGANLGGDTDTIGCIAGMLSGAYSGFNSIRKDWIDIFKKANPELDFDGLTDTFLRLIK